MLPNFRMCDFGIVFSYSDEHTIPKVMHSINCISIDFPGCCGKIENLKLVRAVSEHNEELHYPFLIRNMVVSCFNREMTLSLTKTTDILFRQSL